MVTGQCRIKNPQIESLARVIPFDGNAGGCDVPNRAYDKKKDIVKIPVSHSVISFISFVCRKPSSQDQLPIYDFVQIPFLQKVI